MTQQIAPVAPVSSSDELIAQLTGNTNAALTRLQQETQDPIEQIQALEKGLEEATQIQDEKARSVRVGILTADFETLRKGLETEEVDLSQAVLGLQGLMVTMGKEYEDLQRPSATEQQLITNAEQRLAAAKTDLADAKDKWNIFGSKDRAIAAANLAIAAADQRIIDAKAEVKQMVRNRLLHADIEASLQTFMKMVSDTVEIMKKRMDAINIQVKAVGTRKNQAFNVKESAAKALEILDKQLGEGEVSLSNEEEALTLLTNGSSEYSTQTTKISELRAQVEEVRGKRNTALVLYQSKERFAKELEIHEKAQIKLRDNQRAWITLLNSDTEERVVTFKSKLEAMKAMSDQDIAENLTGVGVQIDKTNAEYMAGVGSASDNRAMAMLEAHPERVKRLAEIQAAQAEASGKIRDRFAVVLEQFRASYGIDPLDDSFFRYSSTDGGTAGAPGGQPDGSSSTESGQAAA